jgi:hypothetical protein
MNTTEKARVAAEIKAFKNTDFSDAPELTDEQIAQLEPSHYRNMANYKYQSIITTAEKLGGEVPGEQ